MSAPPFPETIPDLLEWRAASCGPRPWLFANGAALSLNEVLAIVDRYATGLLERGVGRGDRVALILGNQPEALFTWFAANRLGAAAMPLQPSLKRREVAGILHTTRPRVVVTEAREAALDLATVAVNDLNGGPPPQVTTPQALAAAGSGSPRAAVHPDDVAVLLATSGTTGEPKAVQQTHRTYTLTAESFPAWVGLGEEDRLLAALPLFHINAQAYSVMGALGAGASLALLPKFSASTFWADAARLGATEFNAVGAMIRILANTPAGSHDRAHGVRLCYAALALPEAEHRAFEARFGLSMTVGYGLSETTFGTVWPRDARPYGTMGVLRQHPRLGVVNHARVVRDDGTDAADDEAGELLLRNPAMMRGYMGRAGETEAAFTGPWFGTGDLVRRDAAGSYTFVARKKDVLRRRGENVAAAEIEAVLASHPAVSEAAAVGVPSALGEDEIVAFVLLRSGAGASADELRQWARERLADFKVPSAMHLVDELPRTPTARVAKHVLRARVEALRRSEGGG